VKPTRWRRGRRLAGLVALAVLAAAGLGHAALVGVGSHIHRVNAFGDMKNRPAHTRGTTFLLVGTDGRDGITPTEKRRYHLGGAPCHCTDTLMLAHLSEDRSRLSVVSIPRDTYVRLPQPAKINSAYAVGGPRLTVRTVEQLTGVHVDHYLEVSFTGFMKAVDLLGGVPVCTDRRLRDAWTGLDLSPGRHVLNGGQALQYVRSRHLDGASDLGRMRRQQRFVAEVLARATSGGLLTDPVRLTRVAGALLGSVRADRGLGADDLVALARGLHGLRPGSSQFASVPLAQLDYPVPGVGSAVRWDTAKAGRLWAALRADRPLPTVRGAAHAVTVAVPPASIRVQVENGTRVHGLAARADRSLRATGFATSGLPLNAPRTGVHRTTITYDPGWNRSAHALAAAFPGAALHAVRGQGPVLRVILGADFRRVRAVRPDSTVAEPDSGTAVSGTQEVCAGSA
jgi:LCP family protein required for cell wall assembly